MIKSSCHSHFSNAFSVVLALIESTNISTWKPHAETEFLNDRMLKRPSERMNLSHNYYLIELIFEPYLQGQKLFSQFK